MRKLILSVLLGAVLSLSMPSYGQTYYTPLGGQIEPSSIKLTYPLDNSVFQYSSSGTEQDKANIVFAGQVLAGTRYTGDAIAQRIFIRVQKYDYSNQSWNYIGDSKITFEPCSTCVNDYSEPKTFFKASGSSLNLLSKGWYRVCLALGMTCNSGPFTQPSYFINLNEWVHFGVGDVYYIAGQSNAAGFTREYDKSLAYYESTAAFPTGSTSPPPHLLQDSQIEEGSIVNRILTNDREDALYDVKGLPIFASNGSNLGLQKFVSGKGGAGNEMGMAPNGKDSWSWARFGSDLVAEKDYPVFLMNTAIPGSYLYQYHNSTTNGCTTPHKVVAPFFGSHIKPLLQINAGNFGAKAVLWQQGESESLAMTGGVPCFGYTSPAGNYYQDMLGTGVNGLIKKSRDAINDQDLAWFVSKTSYVTSNDRSDSDVRIQKAVYPLSEDQGNSGFKYWSTANGSSIINQQSSIISSSNQIYMGPDTDGIGSTYRTKNTGTHLDGYEGANENNVFKNGLWKLADAWRDKVKNVNNTTIEAQKINKLFVSKSNGQYVLSVKKWDNSDLSSSGNYRWVVNDGSPFDVSNTSVVVGSGSTYPIPTNYGSGYFLTCYYQESGNKPFIVTQPYYVKPYCPNCRVGNNATYVTKSLTIAANGGFAISDIANTRDGNSYELDNCPSWITVTQDYGSNGLKFEASANGGTARTAIVYLRTRDDSNNITNLQKLTISQAASSSGCTNANLSTKTPSYEYQDWGSLQDNLNVGGGPLKIANVTYSHGLGTHAYSDIRYNLTGGNYATFSGAVGRDDAADGCNCGTQKVQFRIKNAITQGVLWTSNLLGPNDGAQSFSVNISGVNELQLEALDGGDNNWGDHADWVNTVLTCGSGCNVAAPSNPTATLNPITSGQSTTLSSSCAAGTTIKWSTQQSGLNSITVSPTSTTTYSVYCDGNNGCVSSSKDITITVGTPPNCNNTYLGNTWTYGTAGWNAPPKINTDVTGGSLNINNVTYSNGIGTHAFSEIIYDLGTSHNFQSFKADVGRDQDAYGCNCGAQDITFKVVNNANNAVLAGPITKGNWQSASSLTANLSGVRYLKLVVDNGSDGLNYGDYANWANARLVCTSSSRIGEVRKEVLDEPETKELKVIPNPVEGDFKVQFYAEESKLVEIEIYNGAGRLMKNSSGNVEPGENTFSLSSEGLNPGQYIIRVLDGLGVKTKKVVVK